MALNYQIALTNVKFDNSYSNVLRFESRSKQEEYFGVNTLFSNLTPSVNFNAGSLYITNIVYDCAEYESLTEMLQKNYCIIKDNSPSKTLNYYYYFITNSIQDCDNRIKLSLELDIMQTYYLDVNFSDCFISKAHLNRFVQSAGDQNKVYFDGSITSKLFEREDITNVAKRLVSREVIPITDFITSPNENIRNWLKENVLCWVYLTVDCFHAFTMYKIMTGQRTANEQFPIMRVLTKANSSGVGNINASLPNIISTICVPIMKNATSLVVAGTSGGSDVICSIMGLIGFLNTNKDFNYIYNMKISSTPPFSYLSAGNAIIDNNYNYEGLEYSALKILSDMSILPESDYEWLNVRDNIAKIRAYASIYNENFQFSGILNLITQPNINILDYSTLPLTNYNLKYEFLKSEIINSVKDTKFNPKLLSSDYMSLLISDETQGGFNYDLQKLNSNNIEIRYSEPLTPTTTKKYIRITNNNGYNPFYSEATTENLTGFVGSNDTSLTMSSSAYSTMLANQKNFFTQNETNRMFDLFRSQITALGNYASGDYVGLATTEINSVLNYSQSKINQNLTVDNIKSSPSAISLAQGNPIFNSMISDLGVVIELYDILPNEKEMINDYMCQYGFNYNRIGNVKDFDNIRKYYNFVKAEIQETSGLNISNTVHDKFKQIFSKGIRFWNTDNFSYELENYEKWLED